MHIPVHYYSSVVVEICSLCMYNSFITTEHHIGECERFKKGASDIYMILFSTKYTKDKPSKHNLHVIIHLLS